MSRRLTKSGQGNGRWARDSRSAVHSSEHPTPHPYIRVTDMRPGTVWLSQTSGLFPRCVYSDNQTVCGSSAMTSITIIGRGHAGHRWEPSRDHRSLTVRTSLRTRDLCIEPTSRVHETSWAVCFQMSPLIQNGRIEFAIRKHVGVPTVKLALTRISRYSLADSASAERGRTTHHRRRR